MFWILELNFRRSSLHPYFLHFQEGPLECYSSGRTCWTGKLMMIMTFTGSGPIVLVCIKGVKDRWPRSRMLGLKVAGWFETSKHILRKCTGNKQ